MHWSIDPINSRNRCNLCNLWINKLYFYMNRKSLSELDAAAISRVIEMAWEDRTPFEAIEHNYGLKEADVIALMRRQLKPSSFRLWRKRVTGRATKHLKLRSKSVQRSHCPTQYKRQ